MFGTTTAKLVISCITFFTGLFLFRNKLMALSPLKSNTANSSMELISGGFELYVPPTRFSQPPEPARFVMLDDLNDVFYQVIYESPTLKNLTAWTDLALHTINDPAIVFPPNVLGHFEANLSFLATGFLVSITSRSSDIITARKIGVVHVDRIAERYMNWGVLEATKGEELAVEMRAGLLRFVFNRRPGRSTASHTYVTPRRTLDNMPRPWHKDGASLNWELDGRFVGGKVVQREQKWRLFAS